mgnify:CR=1 FL=1
MILLSYNKADPSWSFESTGPVSNLGGRLGANGTYRVFAGIFELGDLKRVDTYNTFSLDYITQQGILREGYIDWGISGGVSLRGGRFILPIGFALLTLQGLSELIKRIAFLTGHGPDPMLRVDPLAAEKELAKDLGHAAGERP